MSKKKYIYRLEVVEGCDEFWEDVAADSEGDGATEVRELIDSAFQSVGMDAGIDYTLKLQDIDLGVCEWESTDFFAGRQQLFSGCQTDVFYKCIKTECPGCGKRVVMAA